MDEEMMQMAAMDQMMGMGGGGMEADPFEMEAAPRCAEGYVPDAVLPAVMEWVSQAEMGGSAMGAAGMGAQEAMMGGVPLV